MSSMVEIVARAIYAAQPHMKEFKSLNNVEWQRAVDANWHEHIEAATAAIAALRDPTPEMIERGYEAANIDIVDEGDRIVIQSGIGKTVWHYMIDAASKEGG